MRAVDAVNSVSDANIPAGDGAAAAATPAEAVQGL